MAPFPAYLSPDDHLAIRHAARKKNAVGVPGIDRWDSGQDITVPKVRHQVACTSRVNINRLVHVADQKPIELLGPDGPQHCHPSSTLVVMRDPDRLGDLFDVRESWVKIVEDSDIVIVGCAGYTCTYNQSKA